MSIVDLYMNILECKPKNEDNNKQCARDLEPVWFSKSVISASFNEHVPK